MAQVEAVLIVLNGRTKVIPLPKGADSKDISVKYATADGPVDLSVLAKPDLRGLKMVRDRRVQTSRENMEKAKAIKERKRAEGVIAVDTFLSKMSPAQRALCERLFRVLGFETEGKGGAWAYTLSVWVQSLAECCPEPWRLDLAFLKKWLSSPYTVANATDAELRKPGKTKNTAAFIRRAVARKLFIEAWEEQIGPVSVGGEIAPIQKVRGVATYQDNHPFTVIYARLRDGQIRSRSDLDSALTEYRAAGFLTHEEFERATQMLATGKWMGELPVPGV